MEMKNGTSVQEFTLEGFPAVQRLGKILFLVHSLAYLASIAGKTVIVTTTCADSRLQTPAYFFLRIFSFFECCFTSAIIPKLLVIFLLGKQTISFAACFLQACVFVFSHHSEDMTKSLHCLVPTFFSDFFSLECLLHSFGSIP